MLVLLIIFLITVPVVDPVGADYPAGSSQRADRNQAGERLADGPRRSGRNMRGLLEPARRSTTRSCSTARSRRWKTRSERSAVSRTSTKRICPKCTSAATSIRRTSASAARSSPCSAPASPASASFRSPPAGGPVSGCKLGASHHGDANHWLEYRRRADDGHQHDAADRRHAGSSDHVHHYHPAADPCGEAGPAAGPAATSRRRRSTRSRTRSWSPRRARCCGTARRST